MKATLSETKKNPWGSNSEGKEARVQIDDLEHKEEINNQPEQNFKKFKKMRKEEEDTRTSPKVPTSES